jgi:hypothetical protein
VAINAGTSGTTISNQGVINYDADGNGTNESATGTDDPGQVGATDPTAFRVLSVAEIPTLDPIGLALMFLLMAGSAYYFLRRRTA